MKGMAEQWFDNIHVVEQILCWLPDVYKLRLLSTCHRLATLRYVIRYTGSYPYETACECSFIYQLDNIHHYARRDLTEHMKDYVTHLICNKVSSFPYRLKHLKLNCLRVRDMPPLPDTLESLKVSNRLDYQFNKATFPKNVKIIDFYEYDGPLDWLPDGLESLTIYRGFNTPIRKLPSNLKKLVIMSFPDFTSLMPFNELPKSLRELHIRCNSRIDGLHEGLQDLVVIGEPKSVKLPQSVTTFIVNRQRVLIGTPRGGFYGTLCV